MNFYQFDCLMRGEPAYPGLPEPHQLRPLDQDAMSRYAPPEDYDPTVFTGLIDMDGHEKIQKADRSVELRPLDKSFTVGRRPQMSDEDFEKYTGIK